jgi:hypothetical protein
MAVDVHHRIGSLTKTFIGTLVLQLEEQGKLSLDDRIGCYVDGVPNGGTITLRNLLDMTSGLVSYTDDPTVQKTYLSDPGMAWTPHQLIGGVLSQPVQFPPGEGWYYSNTNYILLGLVVEHVIGMPLADALETASARDRSTVRQPMLTRPASRTWSSELTDIGAHRDRAQSEDDAEQPLRDQIAGHLLGQPAQPDLSTVHAHLPLLPRAKYAGRRQVDESYPGAVYRAQATSHTPPGLVSHGTTGLRNSRPRLSSSSAALPCTPNRANSSTRSSHGPGSQSSRNDQVIKPVLSGTRLPKGGPKPSTWTTLDRHYEQLRLDMQLVFHDLGIAA